MIWKMADIPINHQIIFLAKPLSVGRKGSLESYILYTFHTLHVLFNKKQILGYLIYRKHLTCYLKSFPFPRTTRVSTRRALSTTLHSEASHHLANSMLLMVYPNTWTVSPDGLD